MPNPSLSRQFHDLENRTEALEGRIGNLEDSFCPACKAWTPSTMTAATGRRMASSGNVMGTRAPVGMGRPRSGGAMVTQSRCITSATGTC